MRSRATRLSMSLLLAALLLALPAPGAAHDDDRWVGTWSAAMQAPLGPAAAFEAVTLRQVVHVSIGGRVVRVRFSNATGTAPVAIGSASVGIRDAGARVRPGTLRALAFGGSPSITVPAGGVALSDPVALRVTPLSDLAVSLHLAAPAEARTALNLAHQTTYVSAPGDFTGSDDMAVASTTTSWFWLTGVEVLAGGRTRTLVAFGDSITEGFGSTTDANARWPDFLARRLQAHRGTRDVAVLNEAISGNRVLNDEIGPGAQRRLDRDLLTQGGLAYVVLLEGTNDMGFSQLPPTLLPGVALTNVSAEAIIAGYKQIIRRVHQAGARIYGGTVLPFEGAFYWDAASEAKRQALNAFIRGSGWFDAVIDFDAAIRDPSAPTKMLPAYDSGDHLHPNDAGYEAMANAVDLALFERR